MQAFDFSAWVLGTNSSFSTWFFGFLDPVLLELPAGLWAILFPGHFLRTFAKMGARPPTDLFEAFDRQPYLRDLVYVLLRTFGITLLAFAVAQAAAVQDGHPWKFAVLGLLAVGDVIHFACLAVFSRRFGVSAFGYLQWATVASLFVTRIVVLATPDLL